MSDEKIIYDPIDMDDYPYSNEEMLSGKIFVVKVVKGTAEDSQNGLIAHKILGYEDDGATPILDEKPVIVRDTIDAMDTKKHKGRLQIVGVNPNPQAQMVFYQDRNEKKEKGGHWRIYSMRPDDFLRFAEERANPEAKPEAGAKLCKATTKAGKPCQKSAVEGSDFCNSHQEG
jgi:hypothetical protein